MVKNIGPQLARVVGIAGATVLGDGQVVLILNPVALASRLAAARRPPPRASPRLRRSAPRRCPPSWWWTILTVRKITGRLLAREGYQVVTAKDGVDALEQMMEVIPTSFCRISRCRAWTASTWCATSAPTTSSRACRSS